MRCVDAATVKRSFVMTINLSAVEHSFLLHQLRRRMESVEWELVHTDRRALQHALALDLDALQSLVLRVESSATTST
jgi:hypothetical protein